MQPGKIEEGFNLQTRYQTQNMQLGKIEAASHVRHQDTRAQEYITRLYNQII